MRQAASSRFARAPRPQDGEWSIPEHEGQGRRWDEQPVRPTKFTQRLAVVLALAIITACVGVLATLSGGAL